MRVSFGVVSAIGILVFGLSIYFTSYSVLKSLKNVESDEDERLVLIKDLLTCLRNEKTVELLSITNDEITIGYYDVFKYIIPMKYASITYEDKAWVGKPLIRITNTGIELILKEGK